MVRPATPDAAPDTAASPAAAPPDRSPPAFLVVDTESVPDGQLLADVKYAGENLTPEAAVERAQREQAETSWNKSDFIPVTFHIPVAVCVLRVGIDCALQSFTCLDAPHYRQKEVVAKFWQGVALYPKAKLVTFNGRGFDLPLMELAAFRQGLSACDYFQRRDRYRGNSLDLQEFLSNFGASRMTGGLNLLAKLLGKPGKIGTDGSQVYEMYRAGKIRAINDYCLCDTLDTYFVFLRTRVLTGDIPPGAEVELVEHARELLEGKADEWPVLREYLAAWRPG